MSINSQVVLTSRQWTIVTRRASGETYQKIGADLGISVKTIGATLSQVRNKLGLDSVPQLLEWARAKAKEGIAA